MSAFDPKRTLSALISYFNITDREGDLTKHLKSRSSIRKIPIHPELERFGFLDYVKMIRCGEHSKLFPELQPGAKGRSDKMSKWFGNFFVNIKIKRPKICYHSFRHSFADAMRLAAIRYEYQDALKGWSGGHMRERYGSGPTVKELHTEISKINYEGLDLSHLGSDR